MNDKNDPIDKALAIQVGSLIRKIRRQKHITQGDLAQRIGIRAGPMNTIEKGHHVPSGRVLYRLAKVLDVPVDAFFTAPAAPSTYPVHGGMVRSESTASYGQESRSGVPFLPILEPVNESMSLAEADAIACDFLALEDVCGAMKFARLPLYIPFLPTESGIEQLVTQVRQHLGITHAVVFDYLELLENAGLRIIFFDWPGDLQSLAAYDRPNGNAFIFIRRTLNAERQLFRLLFELGCVYWYTQSVYTGAPGGKPLAQLQALDALHAARKFAALFLMPALAVQASVSQLGVTPNTWTYELLLRLKHRFGVSAESFAIRLEELALIDPALSQTFKDRIRAHYQQTQFAEPDGSLRCLSHNGRLGDLLLTAQGQPQANEEILVIAQRLKSLIDKSAAAPARTRRRPAKQ